MKKSRAEVLADVELNNLKFIESTTRMNYGHIGNLLKKDDKVAVVIFPSTFYVHDKDFSLHKMNLKLIKNIQKTFKELK